LATLTDAILTIQLTNVSTRKMIGNAHRSAIVSKLRLDASLANTIHGVNRFRFTDDRIFCDDRGRPPARASNAPVRHTATTWNVDSSVGMNIDLMTSAQ